jgi:glycosyltransferase involved in cell wall biosynthesis
LIEPKNIRDIQNAIELMLENKELRSKLGKAARKKARELFDFQKIVENEIIPLYGDNKL